MTSRFFKRFLLGFCAALCVLPIPLRASDMSAEDEQAEEISLETRALAVATEDDPEFKQRVVDTFVSMRPQYSPGAICKFLAYQKPRHILACLIVLIDSLEKLPTTTGKQMLDKLLRGLEAYGAFLDSAYITSESVPVVSLKLHQKPPAGSENFYAWWKRVDLESFKRFGGFYFDYHLISLRASVLSAWELIAPESLYDDPSLRLSLKALEHTVPKFAGVPRFYEYYERMTRKANDFVVAMRKRISQRKWQDGPVLFQSGMSIPRTPLSFDLVGKDAKNTSVGSFCESFLSSYGICLHERYGHEYHEYLLDQTAQSYDELESAMGSRGMTLDGRIMVMGYEGGAFDSYFSNFNDLLGDSLYDETAFKGNAGWSKPPANYFGFLTAFALRDANVVSKNGLFEHIHDKRVELFPRVFELLQRDSFTQLFSVVRTHENSARQAMHENDVNGVLDGFVNFFDFLYEQNLMLSDGQNVATQDILFNKKHIQHLIKSPVKTLKFYTGPDVTYPILPTKQRNSYATAHAQAFAKKFVKHLIPRGGEPTVYVFNSFVDGVGKSTMLGNIKNWIKHGSDMENYEVTDNTSSQLADIFEFAPDVHIADLPAQISHFTYKPDGYVFVDVTSVRDEEETTSEVLDYFIENQEAIVADYAARIQRVADVIAAEGWHAPELNKPENPFDAFAKNLHLLKLVQSNPWVPCEYNGKFYLVNASNYGEVRLFMSLSEAQSSGLKNVRADQMFFFDGITLPLSYKTFLDDLTSRCLERGVKKVVFVDFLSMYMRSSRENIRVNYLMQQMALLFNDFDQKDTVYRDLSGNAELLHYLVTKPWYARAQKNLERESLVRWGFNSLLEEWKTQTLNKISLKESTTRVASLLASLSPEFRTSIKGAVAKKLEIATGYLESTCGRSKEFVNIQCMSWDDIISYAKLLEKALVANVADKTMLSLWGSFGGDVQESIENAVLGECDKIVPTAGGKSVRARLVINPEDRNSMTLIPVFRILRTVWYNTIFQFIDSRVGKNGTLKFSNLMSLLPWTVRKGTNGLIYIVQPNVPVVEEELPEKAIADADIIKPFVDLETTQWACVNKKYFAMDIKESNTSLREYAFGSESRAREIPEPRASLMFTTAFVEEHVRKAGLDDVLMMSDAAVSLQRLLGNTDVTKPFYAKIKRLLAAGNRMHEARKKNEAADPQDEQVKDSLRNIDPEEYPGVTMFLQLAVGLEQVMHDPDATLVVRKGNKQDAIGALQFLETVVLPQYFGVISNRDLAHDAKIHEFLFGD